MCTRARTVVAVAIAPLLISCAACAQRWTFADPVYPGADAPPGRTAAAAASSGPTSPRPPQAEAAQPQPPAVVAAAATAPLAVDPSAPARVPPDLGPRPQGGPPPSGKGDSPIFADTKIGTVPEPAQPDEPSILDGLRPGPIFPPHADLAAEKPDLRGRIDLLGRTVWTDYSHYYSWTGASNLLGGLAAASVLANTTMDRQVADWYQDRIRSPDTDQAAKYAKMFGEGGIVIPVCAGLGVVGSLFEDHPYFDVVGQFGGRVTRSYAVGAPPMLFFQYALGAGRPSAGDNNSYWRPFSDNHGVSGHAFIGSVPFITAAQMVENPYAKGCFYFCSALPAWSRINDNQHYLSQALLGWWMGYMACSAIEETDAQNRRFHVGPMVTPEMTGVMATWIR